MSPHVIWMSKVVVASAALVFGTSVPWDATEKVELDGDLVTHIYADGSAEWALVLPSATWDAFRQASSTQPLHDTLALVGSAFDREGLTGRRCTITDLSRERGGGVKVEGNCGELSMGRGARVGQEL